MVEKSDLEGFTPWTGEYEKKLYDVLLKDGQVAKWVWPNAGRLVDTYNHHKDITEFAVGIKESVDRPWDADASYKKVNYRNMEKKIALRKHLSLETNTKKRIHTALTSKPENWSEKKWSGYLGRRDRQKKRTLKMLNKSRRGEKHSLVMAADPVEKRETSESERAAAERLVSNIEAGKRLLKS